MFLITYIIVTFFLYINSCTTVVCSIECYVWNRNLTALTHKEYYVVCTNRISEKTITENGLNVVNTLNCNTREYDIKQDENIVWHSMVIFYLT